MIGLGTIINVVCIIAGGIIGLFTGNFFKEEQQDAITKACGISVLFIAMAGAMEEMLTIQQNIISSGKAMLIVLCLAIGTIIGELIGIENGFEKFGEWLKVKTGNSKDANFVNAFVTASLTVCIGAMAIVGSIQDGISGDHATLFAKALLDLILVAMISASMGKGAVFSAIPVAILQGMVTILATFIAPIMTDAAISNITLVGNVLIVCVGVNLIWPKTVRVANMLPALIIAVVFSFF